MSCLANILSQLRGRCSLILILHLLLLLNHLLLQHLVLHLHLLVLLLVRLLLLVVLLGLVLVHSVPVLGVVLHWLLMDNTHLLLPLAVEPNLLHALDLAVETLNLKLGRVAEGLVLLELANHVLELFGALLQVLLVNDQFLGHFWSALLCENILELNIEFLLFLNKHVLLADLLSFGDQALLEGLDLLDQLVGVDVGGFEFAPSVNVEGLLEFVLEELLLQLLLKQLLFQKVDFALEVRNALSFGL
jgi:hypothetical protein